MRMKLFTSGSAHPQRLTKARLVVRHTNDFIAGPSTERLPGSLTNGVGNKPHRAITEGSVDAARCGHKPARSCRSLDRSRCSDSIAFPIQRMNPRRGVCPVCIGDTAAGIGRFRSSKSARKRIGADKRAVVWNCPALCLSHFAAAVSYVGLIRVRRIHTGEDTAAHAHILEAPPEIPVRSVRRSRRQ